MGLRLKIHLLFPKHAIPSGSLFRIIQLVYITLLFEREMEPYLKSSQSLIHTPCFQENIV